MNGYRLDDSVLARIVQIVQEGIILGNDVTDLMRQMRLEVSTETDSTLVLTQEYKDVVKRMHDQLLARAEELKQSSDSASTSTIITGN